MRKFAWIALVLVLFAGCSSEEQSSETVKYNSLDVASYDLYDGSDFRIQYPTGWKSLEKEEVVNKYNAEVELVLVSDVGDAFFTPNITVEKVVLPDGVLDLDEIYEGIEKENKKTLLLHDELDRSEFTTFVDGVASNGLIVQFKGKRKLESDVISYLQAVLVSESEGVAYVATVAYDELDSNISPEGLVEALKTFAVK